MRILLAPMEGVLDARVRALLTEINDYDLCVTEFIRVVDHLLPTKQFLHFCPELTQGGKTPSGTPVRVQLLGQSPHWMAENACRAVALGSPGVDLNFGCPAKSVNGSGGGALLLQWPEKIFQIVRAVRAAVPQTAPVSAKIRLGWASRTQALEIADAVQQGGASELTVHGRTKLEGYRAEAIDWNSIGRIRQCLTIPVIANGEIKDRDSARRCQAQSGCDALMVGRYALSQPDLGRQITGQHPPLPWSAVAELLRRYTALRQPGDKASYYPARIKQWLGYLRQSYPAATVLFQQVRPLTTAEAVIAAIEREAHLAAQRDELL